MSGEVFTLSDLETYARLLAQDTDATNAPGLTSAQYYSLADHAYLEYMDLTSEEMRTLGPRTVGLTLRNLGDTEKWTAGLGVTPVPFVTRWLEVYRQTDADAIVTTTPMKIVTPAKVRLMLLESAANGVPEYCAFEKIATPGGAAAIAVAGCTLATASSGASQGQITKSGAFAGVTVGMPVDDTPSNTDIPASSYVVQKDSDSIVYAGNIFGARVTLTAAGNGGVTFSPQVGQWNMRCWPPADTASTYYFSARVRAVPFIPSTVGATYVFDLEPKESRTLGVIVAATASALNGDEPGMADALWGRVPEEIRSAMRARMESARVRP